MIVVHDAVVHDAVAPAIAPSTLPQAVLRPAVVNAFESAVGQLASAIRLGVFVAGDQLPPERELAELLGISRSTLREAIAALRDCGLVATTRGRGGGTVVTYRGGPLTTPAQSGVVASAGTSASTSAGGLGAASRTLPELLDSLDFRRVVEPGAAALAATRPLTAGQREWLTAALDHVTDASAGDLRSHRIADSRLHLAIVTVTGSSLLIEAVTRAQADLDELLHRIPVLRSNIAHSDDQHRAVVHAILSGRPEAARLAMEEHVDGTADLLRGLLG